MHACRDHLQAKAVPNADLHRRMKVRLSKARSNVQEGALGRQAIIIELKGQFAIVNALRLAGTLDVRLDVLAASQIVCECALQMIKKENLRA